MKRLLIAAIALVAAAPLAADAARTTPAGGESAAAVRTTAVCHRTSSRTRPYTKIRVTARQLRTHTRHAADLIPAPRGACPRTILTATRGGTLLSAALVGETEEPAGDPVGTGTATIRLRVGEGRLCFRIAAQNITFPSAGAHIHVGAAGVSGGILVPLAAPATTAARSGCVAVARGVVRRVLAQPGGFYVNVHTTDFPGGAVRGQLVRGSAQPAGRVLTVGLTGAAERPNPGDADGTGSAILRFRTDGQVCAKLQAGNIQLPSVGAHIHRGAATAAGPIVVQLPAPGAGGTSAGCTATEQALIDEILANPAGFYVNVHTRDFPGGAIRGQLG